MLQRGLLTNAEQQQHYHQHVQQQQQQPKPPYDVNLSREQQHLNNMSNSQNINEENKERINCLPIIEMPQIKIEQDTEYMECIEEEEHEQNKEANDPAVQYEEEREEPMEVEDEGQEMVIKPVPQLLEPTSILKTSLLTGAANTLATLTAAAEQIARMPSEENLIKNYSSYYKEENKRSYTVEEEGHKDQEEVEEKRETIPTTYTSILQTALMSKRPATLNVTATCSATSNSGNTNKSLHVRTPDQVLKTAVTLASLGEIAAQQEQQQQQQQQQQQMQQQQPHILVVPQVSSGPRKMCTLPFKKLNFANVTTSATSSTATCLNNTASIATATTATATLAETTTTITNNYLNYKLKQNLNINTNNLITNNTTNCSINSNKQAASNTTTNITNTETSTATFFDTNKFKNNVATICSTSSNSNIQCSTLKIPCIKPLLVTTQTQTEEANNTNSSIYSSTTSSLTTASSLQTTGGNSTSLLRTAVLANSKLPTQNSLQTSLQTPKFPLKTKILDSFKAATNVAETSVVSNIYKHVSANSSNSNSNCNTNTNNSLSNLNIIKNKSKCSILQNLKDEDTEEKPPQTSTANSTAQNVTVVVFETLLPED